MLGITTDIYCKKHKKQWKESKMQLEQKIIIFYKYSYCEKDKQKQRTENRACQNFT